MEFQEGVVVESFKSQSSLEGFQGRSPFILLWFLDVLQNDSSTTSVLILHQDLGMFTFFIRLPLEPFSGVGESDIIAVEVVRHAQVHVTKVNCLYIERTEELPGIEFDVDLLVESSFCISSVVLTNDGGSLRLSHIQ